VELACSAAQNESESVMLAEEERHDGMPDGILQGRVLPKAPRSIKEALASEYGVEWRAALDKELADCKSSDSYASVSERPSRSMNSVMSFRVSIKPDGTLKFRARLCPNGGGQKQGLDFDESYSPNLSKNTVFVVLHVAAHQDWELIHVDIGCAYKEAIPDPTRPMHMRMAKDAMDYGFSDTQFVQLLVNYWGTKDARRKFYAYLAFLLLEFGLLRSGDDPCLFLQVPDVGERVLALLYVDDIAITGGWGVRVQELLSYLRVSFTEIKCEPLSKFVRLQCTRDRSKREIGVHLTDYAKSVAMEHVPDEVPGSEIPLFSTVEYDGLPPGTEKPVWDVNGKMRFMAESSWPELKVATSMIASAGATPQKAHRRGAQKMLQYVKRHCEDHVLVLGGEDPVNLFAFSDASYTPEGDSRYRYGYAVYLSPSAGAVVTCSKRSTTVSHSGAQSEIKAMSELCKAITADRELLALLGEPQTGPSQLYTDSMAGVDLVSNVWAIHPKTRHFNRDINHVRECVQLGIVSLVFVPTDDNPADIFTKVLGVAKHVKFTDMLLKGVGAAAVVALAAAGWVLC
jgi:hypothetical protein